MFEKGKIDIAIPKTNFNLDLPVVTEKKTTLSKSQAISDFLKSRVGA